MANFLTTNRPFILSAVALIILMLVVSFIFHPLTDETSLPRLTDTATGEFVYKQKVNSFWLVGIFIACMIAIWIFNSFSKPKEVSIIRSPTNVWADIDEKILEKNSLSTIKDIDWSSQFCAQLPVSQAEPFLYLIRYPLYKLGVLQYVILDCGADYKTRKDDPIFSQIKQNISIERAISLMYKGKTGYMQAIKGAERLGFSEEDVRQKVIEEGLKKQEESKKATEGEQ